MIEKSLLVYLKKFMNKAGLFPSSKQGIVGVSGGRDSMLLLYCLHGLQKMGEIKKLEVVHMDHGLRQNSFQDGILVSDFCRTLGIPCQLIHLDIDRSKGNLEKRARDKRYEIFSTCLKKGDRLFLGHHIDDSLEWSLLQSFRVGKLESSLGIPVKRGPIARPFMCLSRRQISSWAKRLKIPWIEDESNLDYAFERNYLRGEIIPKIAARHPGYLRHYVDRSNKFASLLGLSAFHGKENPWIIHEDQFGGISLMHSRFENDFVGARRLITDIIERLSGKKRGVLSKQVDKMISAVQNGKRGPLLFSGEVYGFMQQGLLCFLTEDQRRSYQFLDEELAKRIRSLKDTQIPLEDFQSLSKLQNSPIIPAQMIFGKNKSIGLCAGIKNIHPLWPSTSKAALEHNLWFQCLSRLLYCWKKRGAEGSVRIVRSDLIIRDGSDSYL